MERLDDGKLPLSQALALFKEGTLLARRCRDLLGAAEVAVQEALAGAGEDELDGLEEATDERATADDGSELF